MKIEVKGNGKNLTEIDIHEKVPKKKQPETEIEILPESITEQKNITMSSAKTEGVLKSIKTGIATSFAAPFGLALGMSPSLVTLLTAVPQLIGSFSVLFVEKLIAFLKRRKLLMVTASYMESYTWLLVLLLAVLSVGNPWLLIVLVTLDAIFINLQYPVWNSIVSESVPENMLGKYFGLRNFLVGISSLASVVIAGTVLNKTANLGRPLMGFAIIFGIAFIAAFWASRYQSKFIDPNPKLKQDTKHSFKEFIYTIKDNNFGKYTSFFSLYQMVVYIASPFYAIYMLKILNFDYLTFTIVSTAAAVSALVSMGTWGKLIDKYGSKRIMSITAFIIPFSPIFWMMTKNWHFLAAIEALSGIVWAGFNLSCSTFMFESVKPEHKVKFYTYNKVLFGMGVFLGVMLGILLINIPQSIFSSSFLLIFFTSGILRFLTALIFIPMIEEEKVVTINFKEGFFFKHIVTLRPKQGISLMVGGVHYPKLDAKRVSAPPKQTQAIHTSKNQKKDKTTPALKDARKSDKTILGAIERTKEVLARKDRK